MLNTQKSAEVIVVERRRTESIGILSMTKKGGNDQMSAENMDNSGCSQRDNAEHEGYAKAHRSFRSI